MKKISYCVIVLAAVISGARSRASGAIFSNFELSQDVEAVLSGPGLSQSVTQTVSGQGAPQHQVVTLNPGYGGTITATYDVYDNGTTAGFSIQTSAATTAANNTLYEGDDAFPHTNFTLGQAVSYTLSIYSTAYSTADLGLDLATLLPGQGYGDFSPIPGQQYRFSGMFSAGQECVLDLKQANCRASQCCWGRAQCGPGNVVHRQLF